MRTNLRFRQLGLLALACLVCSAAIARSYDDILASGYIQFAVYRDFPPYSYLDHQGQPCGIDVEVGKLIAARLEVEPRWMWITADETVDDDLRNAIWKGHIVTRQKADVMLRAPYDRRYSYAVDGYGLPRNDMVVMVAPYHAESWQIARNLDKVGEVRNLAIFQYQPIGVEIDTLPDFFLSGVYQGRLRKNVRHYASIFQAVEDYRKGNLSAIAGLRSQLEWSFWGGRPDSTDLDADGLEPMGKLSWDIGLAVRHDYRQLGYALEAIITDLIREGELRLIFKKMHVTYVTPSLYLVSATE